MPSKQKGNLPISKSKMVENFERGSIEEQYKAAEEYLVGRYFDFLGHTLKIESVHVTPSSSELPLRAVRFVAKCYHNCCTPPFGLYIEGDVKDIYKVARKDAK